MDDLALSATEADRLIRAFEAQGDHRTGSPGDDACTLWLIDELRRHGVDAEAQPYTFPRLAIERAELALAGRTVPGIPLYDGGFTPADGISAKLIEAPPTETPAAPGAIALWYCEPDPSFFGPGIYDPLQAAHEAGTLGVVIVAGDDQGAPVVRNAERIDDPLSIPVLQVAPRNAVPLQNAATVTLTVDAARTLGPATNVVAAIPGSDPDVAPVVLMTPKSGWFSCAAERGGGHAVWLATAAAIARDPGRRPLSLVCSGGHELHHYGLDAYLDASAFSCPEAHCWIHLGASIGAKEPRPALAAADEEVRQLMVDALALSFDGNGAVERTLMPLGAPAGGEARNVAERGGRFVSILGGHRYFHSPNDTVDLAVDSDSVARHARAVTQVLRTLLND